MCIRNKNSKPAKMYTKLQPANKTYLPGYNTYIVFVLNTLPPHRKIVYDNIFTIVPAYCNNF